MKTEYLALRLNAVRDTQTRTRVSFWALLVLSIALIVLNYNAYKSWYLTFALKDEFYGTRDVVTADGTVVDKKSEVTEYLHKQLLNEYVSTRTLQVPIIGVKVLVSDACFLAGLSFLIGTTWFYFCQRCEHREIVALLKDTETEDEDLRTTVYHCITAGLVLTVINTNYGFTNSQKQGQRPRDKMLKRLCRRMRTNFSWRILTYFGTRVLTNCCSRVFTYLPVIAMLTILFYDVYTFYHVRSLFRPGHSVPREVAGFAEVKDLWTQTAATGTFTILIACISFLADKFDELSVIELRKYYLKGKRPSRSQS